LKKISILYRFQAICRVVEQQAANLAQNQEIALLMILKFGGEMQSSHSDNNIALVNEWVILRELKNVYQKNFPN